MRSTPAPKPSPGRQGRPPSSNLPKARFLFLLLLLSLALTLSLSQWLQRRSSSPTPPSPSAPAHPQPSAATLSPEVTREFLALEAAEQHLAQTLWAPETLAQNHAQLIENFWNSLNSQPQPQPLVLLAQIPLASLQVQPPQPGIPHLPAQLQHWTHDPTAPSLSLNDVRIRLLQAIIDGWQLDQSEWRHVGFQPPTPNQPATSTYEVHLDLSRPSPPARARLTARTHFSWPESPPSSSTSHPTPFGDVRIESWDLALRPGPVAFAERHVFELQPFPRTTWIDPLIVEDLDADGLPEILLVGRNLLFHQQPDGSWASRELSPHHPGLLFTAALADFNHDGLPDLLCVVRSGLILLPGTRPAAWESPALPVWSAPQKLEYAQALAVGDLDLDGHLDVFLGQYRPPYPGGQMPRPFFNAHDCPPSFLLRNLGNTTFDDITSASGMDPHRHRRSYAASFIDLDHDGDLDLLVTSDFAGPEVFENLGSTPVQFRHRTPDWLDQPRAFGMSHALADFDANGLADLLVLGMPQPTADRLHQLGLQRPGFEDWTAERFEMTRGNRLFYAHTHRFLQPSPPPALARAGWAWSAAILDLDANRFPDVFIANGHETRASVRDYEPEFWNHDIYVGTSTPNPAADAYFSSKFAQARSAGWSYGGHDRNRLFLNLDGQRFLDVSHPLGLALVADSRNAVAADLDADGDLDLLVTTTEQWPRVRQTLRLYENTLTPTHAWIAVQLVPRPGGIPISGATVSVIDPLGTQSRPWLIGDAYRTQSPATLHFGLGAAPKVSEIIVHWPGGTRTILSDPALNQVHPVPAPIRFSQ